MNENAFLIIGKTPPPIGGVSIHTSRLLALCDDKKFNYNFYNYENFNLLTLFSAIRLAKVAHIHCNNPLLLSLFVILCKMLKTKSIITIHGNFKPNKSVFFFIEAFGLYLSDTPILINKNSIEKAKMINKNSLLFSSFIPPIKNEQLNNRMKNKIELLKTNSDMLFCTNAFEYTISRDGKEVYGIIPLIEFFNQNINLGLIVSDPKGSYLSYINRIKLELNENIVILDGGHSFFEVLKKSDCCIRNTTTDGDSLSIKEALFLGIRVIASNCVDRPEGVEIFKLDDQKSLSNTITKVINNRYISRKYEKPINGGLQLLQLYIQKLNQYPR